MIYVEICEELDIFILAKYMKSVILVHKHLKSISRNHGEELLWTGPKECKLNVL